VRGENDTRKSQLTKRRQENNITISTRERPIYSGDVLQVLRTARVVSYVTFVSVHGNVILQYTLMTNFFSPHYYDVFLRLATFHPNVVVRVQAYFILRLYGEILEFTKHNQGK
jgi:hypothetical protein